LFNENVRICQNKSYIYDDTLTAHSKYVHNKYTCRFTWTHFTGCEQASLSSYFLMLRVESGSN